MKPVAVFRHAPTEGPGYFATFLDARSIPWQLTAIDEGASVPTDVSAFSGLAFMGGPMSVNDDLPWIPPVLALIREAVDRDLPVIGHCLGGQLISKALGARVSRNPVREIGWGEVSTLPGRQTHEWLDGLDTFMAFHWHGETFGLPAGATRILESEYCPNQAWVKGRHLAMQCHVEMTVEMIHTWCAVGASEIAAHPGVAVQDTDTILGEARRLVDPLNGVASRLYSRWIQGLAR